MNKIFDNKQEFTELYRDAVMSISGKSVEAASDLDRFNALAKLVAEKARTVATKSDARATAEGKKRVYYFSIEFLIGRLLDNYLLNFGVRDMVAEALDDMGFDLSVIENQEPDPALGNGGLGRLAACFLDSMAAEGIAGYGNGMRYRYGLFKQEIVNGSQVEATDEWLTHGYPWEVRRQDKAVTIKFGGRVEGFEENGRTFYRTVDTQDILAVPYDIPVVGYAGETVNKLRVWAAEPVEEHFDLEAFNRGDYALADAERAEAELVCSYLAPDDRVFYVGQGDNGEGWFSAVFDFYPILVDYSGTVTTDPDTGETKMIGGGGELGLPELQPAEGVKNTYYHGFTAQELDDIVRGNGCTVLYIQTLDDIFVQSYANLFTDKLAAAQSGETLLYRVTDAGFAPMPMEVSAQ